MVQETLIRYSDVSEIDYRDFVVKTLLINKIGLPQESLQIFFFLFKDENCYA